MKLPQVLLAAFMVSLLTPAAFAQRTDRHVFSDDAQSLYRRSAFAHGYIHGYEEGFHCANLDWHMGRARRDVNRELHVAKIDKRHILYQDAYGDKKTFMKGYDQGYAEAYNDVFEGKAFRAVYEARAAAAGLNQAGSPDRNFDDGFVAGITAARDGQAITSRDIISTNEWCIQNVHNAKGEYCDGYARGVIFAGGATPSLATQGTTTARSFVK
jgi:hypothetical protein